MRGLPFGSTKIAFSAVVVVGGTALLFGTGIVASYYPNTSDMCNGGTSVTTNPPNAPPDVALNTAIKAVSALQTGTFDSQLAVTMHFGVNIESGGNPYADSSDGGYGYYRLQKAPIDWHPDISIDGTRDPVVSTNYMVPTYRQKLAEFNRTSAQFWKTDPQYAAEHVAYLSEKPAVEYSKDPRRANDVGPAFQLALQQLKDSGISTDLSGAGAGASSQFVSVAHGGCQAPGSGETVPPNASDAEQRQKALLVANSTVDTPYAWAGGNVHGRTPGVCVFGTAAANDCNIVGYDCSGLVLYVLGQAIGTQFIAQNLPHSSQVQYTKTKHFTTATSLSDLSDAQPGDLVFFSGDDGTLDEPGHVGIYIGNGRMINAPQSGEVVKIVQITGDAYWASTFVAMTDPYRWAQSLKAS